ncbi:PAS/PAC sensor signal transduction histidine kinase [Haloterrigena salina JCM 13891]|uniref:histidine kinase n=1 Tax=Haloterrigena salina JCM 13891 TaxID=1227488 RepID=M0C4I4_9EURY|nr:PAS domain S-box protein [Haloterrigena salina]ELZ17237.1 PAS/PAC sensor signal transduction histidine kinase [Haloterrigena salina JCM 13891]
MTSQPPSGPDGTVSDRLESTSIRSRQTATIRVCCVGFDGAERGIPAELRDCEGDTELTVRTVESSAAVLESLAAVDCVVTEADLGETTGLDLLRSIRDRDPKFPVLMLTGAGSEALASRAISAGITDYVPRGDGTENAVDVSDRIEAAVDQYRSELDARRTYAALETAQEGISLLDENGKFTYVNQVYADNYGYDREEMLGRHWEILYPADETDQVHEEILPEVHEEGHWRGQTTGLRADGTTFPEQHSLTEIEDGGLVCVVRDISERKERKRDLELFRTLLDHSTDSVFVFDPETGTPLDVNDTACRELGYSREELLDRSVIDFEAEFTGRDDWRSFVDDLRADGQTTFDGVHRRRDGATFPVEVNATYVELDRGYVLSMARDVTERRRRERQLRESEQRYRTLAEYFPNGIVTLFDHDLEYTLAAGRGFDDIPVEPADLEGANFYDVWPAATADGLVPAVLGTLEGEERSVELSYAGREWILHAVPITDERGDVFAGMTMAQDITERKEYQRRLEETIDRLEESNERLEQFAYAASHDLQEPLRMVSSYLQLIERRYADAFDEDGEEFLAYAIDGADRMREMIDALLTYSRVETRGEPLAAVDLDAVIADVREDLRLPIAESDAEVTVDSLPRVRGDSSQLRQVFQNLLSNAIEYSGDEPPRVHVSAERESADAASAARGSGRWIVSISDEGLGIDPEDQERIFEVFERLHSRGEYDGTGIGLALCQRIVERHDGEIRVDSTPGEGATFSVVLPAVDDA